MARVALSAVFVGLVACTTPPPQVTALDAERANVGLAQLERGRTLLISKCSGCHATPMPGQVRASEWPKKLEEMAQRSGLTTDQHELIQLYLVVKSAP